MVLTFVAVALGAPEEKEAVDYSSQIRPILSAKCFHCHGPDDRSRKAKLRLDLREPATREREGIIPIKPGDLKNSALIRRITSTDPEEIMPPPKAGHPLTAQDIALLKRWIQQGAPYAAHWSFTKPVRPPLPKVAQRSWPKNGVDHFILAKLEANKLRPSPLADRYTLIRRLSLDLIGLPPPPVEVDAFVQDKSMNAFYVAESEKFTSGAREIATAIGKGDDEALKRAIESEKGKGGMELLMTHPLTAKRLEALLRVKQAG